MKHTNGPWTVGKPYGASKVEIEGPSVTPGMSVLVAASEPRNARLIASAPDLLAALEQAHKYLLANVPKGGVRKNFSGLNEHACLCKAIHAAIAKAVPQ